MVPAVDVAWPCESCPVDHSARGWRTTTPGLVVMQPTCPQEDDHDWWSITHLATGMRLPAWFDSPEHAMACAASLGALWDWTICGAPEHDVQLETCALLREYGGTGRGQGKRRDIRQRNEVA
jgi:hypothetical protein